MVSEQSTIEGEKIGAVTHYYDKIGVAVIELARELRVGDKVKFKGKTTDFEQEINSLQIEHAPVTSAAAGQSVGVKVGSAVNEGDLVLSVG